MSNVADQTNDSAGQRTENRPGPPAPPNGAPSWRLTITIRRRLNLNHGETSRRRTADKQNPQRKRGIRTTRASA